MNRITIAVASFGALCVAGIVLLIVGFAIDAGLDGRSFRNVSESMSPTLYAGEYFTVRGWKPGSASALRRGVLVTHRFPLDPSKRFVKRIIGLPGDTIAMVDRQVRINGVAAAEAYAWHSDTLEDPIWDEFKWQARYLAQPPGRGATTYRPSRDNWGPLVIPAGQYFVLGDNRDDSLDSRYWGFVPVDQIEGIARRVYFSFDAKTGSMRWSRLGAAVR